MIFHGNAGGSAAHSKCLLIKAIACLSSHPAAVPPPSLEPFQASAMWLIWQTYPWLLMQWMPLSYSLDQPFYLLPPWVYLISRLSVDNGYVFFSTSIDVFTCRVSSQIPMATAGKCLTGSSGWFCPHFWPEFGFWHGITYHPKCRSAVMC